MCGTNKYLEIDYNELIYFILDQKLYWLIILESSSKLCLEEQFIF